MSSLFLYVIIASTTIASPGPGVVMTLMNSLKYGLVKSISGILGISLGMFTIAVLVGSGIGVLISNSESAYFALKIAGAIYLFYLGFKMIKNRNFELDMGQNGGMLNQKKSFFYGLGITVINPKPIVFFLALFPQFISPEQPYFFQFMLLSMTFCILIIVIHLAYGIFAGYLRKKTSGANHFKYVNIFGGIAYIIFAISLVIFNKK